MFKPKIIYSGLVIYFILRVFSYYFTPSTPLLFSHWLNSLVAIVIVTIVVSLLIKKNNYAWYVVAGEIILGGGGNYLEIAGIALRTWILLLSLSIYWFQKMREGELGEIIKKDKTVSIFIFALFTVSVLASLRGYFLHHGIHSIWSDFLPYLFLFYYYPLRELLTQGDSKAILLNLLFSAIVGNFLLIILTFFGFNFGWLVMQDYYYHWYRDVAGGKITPLPFGFYRLVLNEHLLLIPIILLSIHKIIYKKYTRFFFIILLLSLFIFSLNLTRIYLLALVVGLLALFNAGIFKRWLAYSSLVLILFFGLFTINHTIASRGQSFGWEIFGVRLQSIAVPQIEESSLSRLLLLPKILEKIKTHPIVGAGLGDVVTVYSPILKQTITTSHFDWGYLEIWAEMGLYGLLVWLGGIIYILIKLIKKQRLLAVACAISLGVINLTSPGLFHVMGILGIIVILANINAVISEGSHQHTPPASVLGAKL